MTMKPKTKTEIPAAWYPLLEDLASICETVAARPTDQEDDVEVVPQSVEIPTDVYKLERAYARAQNINGFGKGWKDYNIAYGTACHMAGVALACRTAMKGMKEPERKLTEKQDAAAKKLWPLILSRPGSSWSREMSVLLESPDMNIRLLYGSRLRNAFPDMDWSLIGALDVLIGA